MAALTLYIIRGLSGSGKTTLAEKLVRDRAHMCAADDYFYWLGRETNEYAFDPSKLKEAHEGCQEKVEMLMRCNVDTIAVHNTFSQAWEAEPYFKLADDFGYTAVVIECQSRFQNTHGVPEETIRRMVERWEPLS